MRPAPKGLLQEGRIMEFSPAVFALGKLAIIFGCLVLLLRLRFKLWQTILAGSLATALLTGLSPAKWPQVALDSLFHPAFLMLCLMVYLILLLSSVQEASGQSEKLVDGLQDYLKNPRVRLVIFPALIGLLPMPGGALFSCPMIKAAAKGMGLTNEKKGQINYWFRHIWESSWPLYPGYALLCSLLGISLTVFWRYTFPMIFVSFAVGWFFFLRDLARSPLLKNSAACAPEEESGQPHKKLPLSAVLVHTLPLAVTLLGAVVFSVLFDIFLPHLPSQLAFSLSLACAIATALYQGRGHMKKSFSGLLFSQTAGKMLLLLVSVFLFKDTVAAGGLVQDLSGLGDSAVMVCLTFVIVPFISGLLTGVMVGFVGVCVPILIGIIGHSPLQEYALPLFVLAMIAGNAGQMLSPLHVCLVVTCEFFSTSLPSVWRTMLLPTLALFLGGVVWASLLAAFGASF